MNSTIATHQTSSYLSAWMSTQHENDVNMVTSFINCLVSFLIFWKVFDIKACYRYMRDKKRYMKDKHDEKQQEKMMKLFAEYAAANSKVQPNMDSSDDSTFVPSRIARRKQKSQVEEKNDDSV